MTVHLSFDPESTKGVMVSSNIPGSGGRRQLLHIGETYNITIGIYQLKITVSLGRLERP